MNSEVAAAAAAAGVEEADLELNSLEDMEPECEQYGFTLPRLPTYRKSIMQQQYAFLHC